MSDDLYKGDRVSIGTLSPLHINAGDRNLFFYEGPIKILHSGGAALEDEIYIFIV